MPYLMGLIHPAAITRGQWADGWAQVKHLTRAVQYVNDPDPPPLPDRHVSPPGAILHPTLAQLHSFHQQGDAYAVDIEDLGDPRDPPFVFLGIGFTSLRQPHRSIYIPFVCEGGRLYWSAQEALLSALTVVDGILGDPAIPLVFHNGVGHDIPVLKLMGFRVEGVFSDTMLMAHLAYPELRKGLQAQATLHLGFPVWKDMVKPGEEEEGKV